MKICYSINEDSYNKGLISLDEKFIISKVDCNIYSINNNAYKIIC